MDEFGVPDGTELYVAIGHALARARWNEGPVRFVFQGVEFTVQPGDGYTAVMERACWPGIQRERRRDGKPELPEIQGATP